ncbi:hypothetical protein GCM10019059_43430 [Camelimonas fluminis]|nr:hypothetical protein GCM10019059_43430 [Camelimonas fluminis]
MGGCAGVSGAGGIGIGGSAGGCWFMAWLLGFHGAKSSAHVWVPVQSFAPLLHQQWCVCAFDM